MTEIAPAMSSTELTPPSPPLSPHQNMSTPGQTSSPQPISCTRRLKHAKSPIFPSSDYRIPHTSLYQFPSDGSLASAYASRSSAGSPKLPVDAKMFTAVIPPLAAVPPTAPLPPTPPKQGTWGELLPQEAVEIFESHRKSKSMAPPKVEVVVGIIKDVRAEKEVERQKRGLRRMKGNVGEATSAQSTEASLRPAAASTHTRPNLATDSGPPTPEPTPPSSAKIVTPPRTLHHPKPYKLPVRKLDFSKSNRSSYSEADAAVCSDGDDDPDGGIAIDYVDEPQESIIVERGRKPAALDLGKPGISGADLPRPDSPFVTGFALHFDEVTGADETGAQSPTRYGYGSEDEGVRLSACKRSFPEFIHSPKRINSDKAELVEFETCQPNNPTAPANAVVVVAAQEPPTNVGGNDSGLSKEGRNAKNEESKSNVDEIIHRSSILKRRHPSNSCKGISGSEKLISPPHSPKSWIITHKGTTQTSTSSIFTPPQLPQFNFIPATPLPLMSPTSVFDKQLDEHGISLTGTAIAEVESGTGADMPRTPADTTSATTKPVRPSMTRSKAVRDSRLHPWWRPRNHYLEKEANFAKLLEGTSFTQSESERGLPSEWDSQLINTTPRAEWTEYGPVRVDKKRKLVGVGGVQIQWVGLGGWYDRIVGGKKEEVEKGKGEERVGPEKRDNLKRKGWIDF